MILAPLVASCCKFHLLLTDKNNTLRCALNTIFVLHNRRTRRFAWRRHVVKHQRIRKTYWLYLQRKALLSVIFTPKTFLSITFLLKVGIRLSTTLNRVLGSLLNRTLGGPHSRHRCCAEKSYIHTYTKPPYRAAKTKEKNNIGISTRFHTAFFKVWRHRTRGFYYYYVLRSLRKNSFRFIFLLPSSWYNVTGHKGLTTHTPHIIWKP